MTAQHRTVSVDPSTRTGICALCGPVPMVYRKAKNRPSRWQCKIARDQQRGDRGDRGVRWPDGRPSRAKRKTVCEGCRVRPSPRARKILAYINGVTLCANCRTMLRLERRAFLRALDPDLAAKLTRSAATPGDDGSAGTLAST